MRKTTKYHITPRAVLSAGGRKLLPVVLVAGLLGSFPAVTAAQEKFKLNSQEMEIQQLIKYVADRTNVTVILDPKVKGKVKVMSSKEMTADELYQLFLTILEVHGYAAVEADGVIRIIPSKEARSQPVPLASPKIPGEGSEFVTQVIQLDNVNAAKLIPILRPLVPQQAHMAAYAESNSIIISDTAANIQRIQKVIDRLDRSSLQEAEFVKLQHASAEETVRILEKLEKSAGSDAKTAPQKRVQLVADKRTNSIIISGDPVGRQRVIHLIGQLDSPLETAGNANVVYLRYAKAKELAEVLGKVTQNMAKLENEKAGKGGGKRSGAIIEADEATNSLIITAEADVMQALKSIIDRLDIPRAQVLVEAIIVEVVDDGGRDFGIEWLFANQHDGFGSFADPDNALLGGVASAVTENDFEDRIATLGGALATNAGGAFGVGRLKENGTSFTAVLRALESDKQSNILSTPSLLTLDNNEASIIVGQEVPFVTGSYTSTGAGGGTSNPGNPFQTIERQNVGISLKVTPHINEGGAIILELEQEVSSLTGASASDLITNERKIDTSVLTSDGEVIVLGGLIKDEVRESEKKVPLLGDIPLLGRLFRSNATDVVKTNLLVFIRPTIIRNDEKLHALSQEKYKFIRDKQVEKRDRGINLYSDDVSPILPEWESQVRQIEMIRKSIKAEKQATAAQAAEQAATQ